MFGVMVAGSLRSDCQFTINKKEVGSCKRSLNGDGNALADAVTLLMIIGVITVAIWLLSYSE
jgi:hypothetical protein